MKEKIVATLIGLYEKGDKIAEGIAKLDRVIETLDREREAKRKQRIHVEELKGSSKV